MTELVNLNKLDFIPKEIFPGLYEVQTLPSILIDVYGNAYTRDRKEIPWLINNGNKDRRIKGGYRYNTRIINNKRITFTRHRCMLLAFTRLPDNIDNKIVNHIDGIAGNDVLDNLEWVTYSENLLHAYKNKLRKQNITVLSRDVVTGKITEYYSISEAARAAGLACDEAMRLRLYSSKFCMVFPDGKQYKLGNDARQWVVPDNPAAEIIRAKRKAGTLPIYAKQINNNKVIVFNTIAEASNGTGVKTGTIGSKLRQISNTAINGWLFSYSAEFTAIPIIKDIPVCLLNIDTGTELVFKTITEVSKITKTPVSSIASKLNRKDTRVFGNKWRIKREGDEWHCLAEQLRNRMVYAMFPDGKLVIANNSAEMATALGTEYTPRGVRRAAKNETKYKGIKFSYNLSPLSQ